MCLAVFGQWGGTGLQDVWANVEVPLKIAQTTAVMEILHAAVGIVRSPVIVTAIQVASRIWALWGIVCLVPQATTTASLTIPLLFLPFNITLNLITLLTAWCCSEVIRYGFFAFKEAGKEPYVMQWLRYSGFLVLYPLGVSSELAMAWLALPTIKSQHIWSISLPNFINFGFSYYILCILIALAYIPGFPMLYGYMLAQRKKVLGREKSKGKKKVQ